MNTTAVPLTALKAAYGSDTGRPICPMCTTGRLHPYVVDFMFDGASVSEPRVTGASGWVAICVGSSVSDDRNSVATTAPCGFSMQLTPSESGAYR